MAAQDNDWETLETDNFVIEYQSGYEEDAQDIGRMGERARTEILAEIPYDDPPTFDNPIHIRVYPEEQWNRPASTQYWKTNRGSNRVVRIHLQAPSEAEYITMNDYERGLWHEYMNIVLWDTGTDHSGYGHWDRNPLWFPEGLSDYYVFQSPSVTDSFPSRSIREVNESIQSGETDFDEITQHEYAGGHLLSMYMVDEYGEDAVWRVLRSSEDFWPAVQSEFGVSKTEFVDGWNKWSERHVEENNTGQEKQTQSSTPDSESIDTSNESTSEETESEGTESGETNSGETESETPGFGIGSGIAAFGVAGYILRRRHQ
jgi:PGF-CTERM protein